jgi:RNA polymerase sigma-70 factor (ECF subfamily)
MGVLARCALSPDMVAQRDTASAGLTNAAAQGLLKANYTRVWRLLRSLGVPAHRLDDAAQQVFLVYAERQQDVAQGSESSFLYGTALRVAHRAREGHTREVLSDASDLAPSGLPGVEELSDQKRAREILDHVLEQMETSLRTVFVLYELEELTVPEIADIVGVPLGTASSRLRRAREQFSGFVAMYSTQAQRSPK